MCKASHGLAIVGLITLLAACGGSDSSSHTPSTALTVGGGTAGAGIPGVTTGSQPPAVQGPATTATLPKMHIDIEGGAEVADSENYLTAAIRIESDVPGERLEAATDIRGRGNATWTMPKKPYRLRLKSASPILGMPAERDWALLANYADKTLLRNELAMTLGERLRMAWTPRSRFVELFVNGRYDGVYQVFEHVKTGPNRAAVDPEHTAGDWLLEVDVGRGEDVCWSTNSTIVICVKSPGLALDDIADSAHPSAVLLGGIMDYINDAEHALHSGGEAWRAFFDVPALIDWYLVNELMRNHDARLASSVYLHKRKDGPLVFGPLWDFDIAGGNFEYADAEQPSGWWVRESVWHSKMFDRRSFREEVFQRWCALKRETATGGFGRLIDEGVAALGPEPVKRNFERWPILGVKLNSFYFSGATTYPGEVAYLKDWLARRTTWIDSEYRNEFGECPAATAPAAANPPGANPPSASPLLRTGPLPNPPAADTLVAIASIAAAR